MGILLSVRKIKIIRVTKWRVALIREIMLERGIKGEKLLKGDNVRDKHRGESMFNKLYNTREGHRRDRSFNKLVNARERQRWENSFLREIMLDTSTEGESLLYVS